MPATAKRPCGQPGCPEIVEHGMCHQHASARRAVSDRQRGSAHERLYTARWQKIGELWRKRPENRLCVACAAYGVTTLSEETDHVIPHRGDLELFWDRSNWQALCKPCHSRKTGGGE